MSDSTAGGPCHHCFCIITTGGDLKCHRCNMTKPFEPPVEFPCFMCGGTGKTHAIRTLEGSQDLDIPEDMK
jgi:hypothetical protein